MVDLRGKHKTVKAHPDFKDPKYKVGYGKSTPQNETRTDFKHKRIVLAKQSGISDHLADPQLELFARCRHYAPKRRLEGFRELQSCRSEISAGMRANFISVICQGLVDEEKDVRRIASSFFHEFSDSSSASEALGLSLRAALSHVQSEIRTDALRLALAARLEFLPETAAIEICKSLVERRLTPEISALLLKLVREVFARRDASAAQWRIASLRTYSPQNRKFEFLTSLVQKIALPDDLRAALTAQGFQFPVTVESEIPKRVPKDEAASVVRGRTFGVGGRGFAALLEEDEEEQ